jgi:CHAT domain-containing protein/Tfp pilus assembly protein PilF
MAIASNAVPAAITHVDARTVSEFTTPQTFLMQSADSPRTAGIRMGGIPRSWVPHLRRSFIASKVGDHKSQSATLGLSAVCPTAGGAILPPFFPSHMTLQINLAAISLVLLLAAAPGPSQTRLDQLSTQVKYLAKQGKFAQALPLAQKFLKLAESARPTDLGKVNVAVANLAFIYDTLGRYTEAEPLFLRALSMDEKELGPNDPDVATDLDKLATIYTHLHRYADAEPLFLRAMAINDKAKDVDQGEESALLSDAASLFQDEGKFAQTESLYRRALAIDHKLSGDDSTEVATDLNNFANLYDAEGKYAEAEALYKSALSIDEKNLSPDDPGLATDLHDLADHYSHVGDSAQAESLGLRALHIREKALGPDSPQVASTLNILAQLYQDDRRYAEAEPLFERSLKIREKVFGTDNPGVATGLNNLGSLDESMGQYDKAEALYRQSLGILEKFTVPGNPDLETAILNLAIILASEGKVDEAEPLFQRGFLSLFNRFQANSAFMTEKERLGFLDLVPYIFPRYFSFVHTFHDKNPALTGSMYNLLLWQKGFVAGSVTDMRRQVEASGDTEALKLLGELSAKRTQLAALLSVKPSDNEAEAWHTQVDKLRADADQAERALVARSSAFTHHQTLDRTTWQQVRDALQPGEAAIEFARFRFYPKTKTNSVYYAALVITRETKDQPRYIFLGDDKQIESDAIAHFKESLATRGFQPPPEEAVPGPHAYELVWKPLESALAGITRVDLATDGVLNQVPLGIIPAPDGKLMMEKYDLRLVSSTRDLLRPPAPAAAPTALLIGNPTFDLSDDNQRAALGKLGNPKPPNDLGAPSYPQLLTEKVGNQTPSTSNRNSTLPSLPGTGIEVEAIADLLHQHGWQTTVYTGDSALKTVVTLSGSPRVLHLATHGFFLPDPEGSSEFAGDIRSILQPEQYSALNDPMLRSGLYFAAADRTLAGKPSPPDLDNGVLTALEAGNLNLEKTQLVVLSACDTGKGDEKNGEGVFGLRRALEEAGAQSVLMSLWSVPDKETLDLMQRFYAEWLGGTEMHQALKAAQLEMREEVKRTHDGNDLPYYWGAFVLVGR